MNKTMIKVALVASVFAFGGCSTYNSYAPDWAKWDHRALRRKQVVTLLKKSQHGGIHSLGNITGGGVARRTK